MKSIYKSLSSCIFVFILAMTATFSNAQTIVSGIKAGTPFITTATNVTATVSNGAGVIYTPRFARRTITFGTGNARTGGFAADTRTASAATAETKGEWVEWAISPASGYDLNITGITLRGIGTVASATNYYAVAYSVGDTTSFANGTANFLDSAGSAGNVLYTSSNYLASGADTTGQSVVVSNGTTVYLRVYMWGAAARVNTSVFTINGFILSGSVTPTQATSSTTNVTICSGGSYLFNGTSYTASGTYTYHTLNSVGADSAAILNLTVSAPATSNALNLVGCSGVTYKGVTYTSPTFFTDTVRTAQGCDSIYNFVTISINCTPVVNSFTPTTAANGDTVTIKGINFTGTTAVNFGGTNAIWFSVVNDTTLLATVGTGTSGTIYVINANGTGFLAGFVYNPANIIKGIKATTPFLNAGVNVTAAITHGSGLLQVPAYRAGTIVFGTRRAGGAGGGGGFAADGATATFDTANSKNEYVQFAISPALGYNMNISGITIAGNGTAVSATDNYAVAYAIGDSTLFASGGETFLDSAGNTGNILYRSVGYLASGADTTGQSVTVNDGSTIYVRVYMWNASARANASQFTISNFTMIGTLTADATSSITKTNICYGGSYLFNGTSYTSAGTYTSHLLNVGGGDSTAILKLTVSPQAKTDTLTYINCTSVTYKNVTYTATTSFVDTVISSLGCDSIYHNVNISISCVPVINSFFPTNAAIGDTVTISGVNFTGASAVSFGGNNAASFTVVSDTLLQAIVGNGSTGIISITTPNGIVTATGFVYNTANIITGIKATTPFITAGKNVVAGLTYGSGMLEVPAGARRTITFGTRAARTAGFAADGATANFDTSNAKNEYVQFAISPVSGYKLNINGITIKGNGTVANATDYYAIAYSVGDSTAFANGTSTFLDSAGSAGNIAYRTAGYLVSGDDTTGLNVLVQNNTKLYVRVYLWNASARANASQFTLSTFTVYGSVTSAATSSTTDTSICAGKSFTFNGVTYDSTGSYTAILTNSVGADSLAHLNLIVKDTSTSTTKQSICQGGSYTFNGTTYSKAGTYSFHLTNAVGCDSLATLVLTVKDTSTSTTKQSICQGGSYTFNGTTYSKAGTYSFHLTNAVGCDSLATLVLTVTDTSTSTTIDSICAGSSYTFNGSTYTIAGTYAAHLTNAVGCDSTAYLVLSSITKKVPSVSIKAFADTVCSGTALKLTATSTNGGTSPSYQWSVNGIAIPGYSLDTLSYTSSLAGQVSVTCKLTSNATCLVANTVTSNVLPVTVNPLITPKVSIAVNPSLGNPQCERTLQFTATAEKGLVTNTYQWTKNWSNISGATSDTVSIAGLANGDIVACFITASGSCVVSPDTTSDNIVISNIIPSVTSSVSISSQLNGTTETFTATPVNGGSTPTYQWYKNTSLVGSDSTYTDSSLVTGDSVWLVLYSSAACNIQPNDTSNIIIVTNPLPVSIKAFTVSVDGNHSVLNWATATELNTSHFNVQHSTDGSNFSNIGNVKAIGSGANSYQFTDKSPANGTNYYRLQSVDKDGASTYSKIVSASLTINDSRLTIYPNPAKDYLTIKGNHIASVNVLDNMGRLVSVQSLKDATNPSITVASLPAGVYHLRIQTTAGSISTIAFVKQ